MYARIIKITFIAIITAVLAVGFGACSRGRGNRVVVKGSTTVLPITQKAAEEFKKETGISVFVEGSGSGNGIKALLDGGCDIANASRQMKPEELSLAASKGLKIKEITIAYDMIVPIVNPSNQVHGLTTGQLKAIYTGGINNWKKVGGKSEEIVVVSRDTSSGTYEVWEEKILHKADVRKDALLQASNGAVVTTVAGNPKAIGYIGYGYLDNSVKAVTVNNIPTTIENGKSGKYPIARKLYMYVNEEKLSDNSKKFIDFLLGTEGQKIVKEVGYIPL
jgi:phosphate transport system substrate-binding protein